MMAMQFWFEEKRERCEAGVELRRLRLVMCRSIGPKGTSWSNAGCAIPNAESRISMQWLRSSVCRRSRKKLIHKVTRRGTKNGKNGPFPLFVHLREISWIILFLNAIYFQSESFSATAMTLFSIGHSNAQIDAFLELLRQNRITAVIDARSKPYSRYNPHFSRDALKQSLEAEGVEYVYLGDKLGGRPESAAFYFDSGRVDYEQLADAPFYLEGVEQMLELAENKMVAFMCAEADYKKCHRYWLITRTLLSRGIEVRHILHSGEVVYSEVSEFERDQPSLY